MFPFSRCDPPSQWQRNIEADIGADFDCPQVPVGAEDRGSELPFPDTMFKDAHNDFSLGAGPLKSMMSFATSDPNNDLTNGMLLRNIMCLYEEGHSTRALDSLFLALLFQPGTIVTSAHEDGDRGSFYICSSHEFGAIGWPVVSSMISGREIWQLQIDRSKPPLQVLSVLNLADWKAQEVILLSRIHQSAMLGEEALSLPMIVFASNSAPMSLLECAARAGLPRWTLPQLRQLLTCCGWELPAGSAGTVAATFTFVVARALPDASEAEVADILACRGLSLNKKVVFWAQSCSTLSLCCVCVAVVCVCAMCYVCLLCVSVGSSVGFR